MKIKFILLLVVLSLSVSIFASCGEDGNDNGDSENTVPPIEYIKENMADYITLPESGYKNLTLNLNISAPTELMTQVEVLKILASSKTQAGEGEKIFSAHTIGAGDTVSIFYRGYYLDEDGKEVFVDGMSNFDYFASELGIGSGQFIPGFEYNMVGKNTGDYAKFERIVDGVVSENHVIYLSYKCTEDGKTESASYERIDLASADAVYGEGFSAALIGKEVNKSLDSFTVTLGDSELTYSDLKVEFVTLCEKESTNGGKPIMVVECYFPHNYQMPVLRNKTAYFEVYVDYVIDYTVPEYNDDFIRGLIADGKLIKEEELNKYEGESLTEKLESYIDEVLYKNFESDCESLIEGAIWQNILEAVAVKKYPEGNVKEIYDQNLSDIQKMYDYYGGKYLTPNYQLIQCETLDEFVILYLGLEEGADWKAYLRELSCDLVKERLIICYILQAEELVPDSETLAKEIADLRAEFVENQGSQYADYADGYFEELVYYDIMIEFIKENSTVSAN